MNILTDLLTEFNQEDYDRHGRAEGYEEGVVEGSKQAAIANAKNFLRKSNLSPDMIAECCALPLEQVLALKEELSREAVSMQV